jgi:hypothetical protein
MFPDFGKLNEFNLSLGRPGCGHSSPVVSVAIYPD